MSDNKYIWYQLCAGSIDVSDVERQRMEDALASSGAPFLYADYRVPHVADEGNERPTVEYDEMPCIDYQIGSLRDDFDFGAVIVADAKCWHSVDDEVDASLSVVQWYQRRLALVRRYGLPFHLNEVVYTFVPTPAQAATQFDYVDVRNRDVQRELEQVVTGHLRKIGAFVDYALLRDAPTESMATDSVVASVVIPVYNREATIRDAVRSALAQQTTFTYNVIVVDNHSTDGTTEALASIADSRMIHIIPDATTLRIGGCWNRAVADACCGRYVVQLDSDDIYSDEHTLQRVVDTFETSQAMAVVGSYTLTDFDMNVIPPGVIDHREWTDENGMNNALRINGLGAPRAFRRDWLRCHPLPNVSYGEDYAAMLMVTRNHRLARIFDSIYYCRRWSGNSDASLTRAQQNRNNYYKDKVRTLELLARLAQSTTDK